jgi:hypothetical protein
MVRFRKMSIGDVVLGRFDALVCVNFIHLIPPTDLRKHFKDFVQNNLAPDGMLVFDIVKNSQYRFNHDPSFLLEDLDLNIVVVDGFEFGRSLVFARKIAGA